MKKKLFRSLLVLLSLSMSFVACSSDSEENVSTAPLKLVVQAPLDADDVQSLDAKATLTNVQTGATYSLDKFTAKDGSFSATAELPVGSYNVALDGKLVYQLNGQQVSSLVKASANGVTVAQSTIENTKTLALSTYHAQDGFVISEIYYTGSLNAKGTNSYMYDQYVKITNNSDQTLYADSIAFLESEFLTSSKHDYTPDMMNKAFSVDAVYMIPGHGKDHPVKPGESITLAIQALDHTTVLAGTANTSKADFEFYDESASAANQDVDNPDVPNLDKWYSYTQSIFLLHQQGYKAYAIARMNTTKEEFLKNNAYKATYKFVFGDISKDMSTNTYFVPNAWILDAVNLGVEAKYEWNVTSPALDAGYTYVSTKANDKARFGKAVIRKMENGKYVDTNNSANDFIPASKPSLVK